MYHFGTRVHNEYIIHDGGQFKVAVSVTDNMIRKN